MRRLATAAVVLVTAAGLTGAQLDPERAKEERAELAARNLTQACEAYYLVPGSKNTYPKSLDDLVKPSFGGAPFVRDAKDLIDPWGKQFSYRVAPNAKGEDRPHVWSERVVGGKTKVVGTKPPEPKKK